MAMLRPALEHQHVVRHVADCRDLRRPGPKVLRQIVDDGALVRVRVGDVELVGLRPVRRRALRRTRPAHPPRNARPVMIVAHADDLDGPVERSSKSVDDLRLELDRPCSARDVRRIGLA